MRILVSSDTKKRHKYGNKPIKNSSFVDIKNDTHVPQTPNFKIPKIDSFRKEQVALQRSLRPQV